MFNFLVGLLAKLGGSFFGMLGGALGEVKNAVGEAAKEMLQYNQRAIAFGRQMGMSLKESQAYSEVLVSRAKDLGKAYGIAAEEVLKIQENLSNATGKALMLNDAQAETIVQINKLVGSNVYDQFTSEMMNGMGAQLGAVQGAVSKAYATAAKSGLNAAQFSEKVAKNLSMANRLSFKDGVNGIIRMTALSEKLGINMASVESAAKNFMDLDKAIENAAHMQMLGGSAAASFGNPLTAAYEANYDPEAFAKRMSDSLASYATFDANKGYANINGMNMDFVRNIAKAMGISEEDAVKNAKKQAEIKYKEGAFGATLGNYSQEQRDFILNKSYVENGKLMINDTNGNKHDISSGKLPENMLKEMMKFTNMDDSELMRQQALSLTSIDETVKGYKTSFTATIAEPIIKKAEEIQELIKRWGDMAIDKIAVPLSGKLETFLDMLTKENGFLASLNKFAMSLTGGFFKAIISNLEWILGGVLAIKAFKFGKGAYDLGKSLLGKGGGSGGAAKAISNWSQGIRGVLSNGQKRASLNNFKGSYGAARNSGKSIIASIKHANKISNFGNLAGKSFAKIGGTGLLGAGLAIGQGAIAVSSYNKQKDKLGQQLASGAISKNEYNTQLNEAKTERNESVGGSIGMGIGTVVGTAIAGPVGAAIGGLIGQFGGQYIGKHWEDIKGFAKSAWESTKEMASSVWGGIKDLAKGAWNLIPEDARKSISSAFDTITPIAEGAWSIIKGQALGTFKVIKGAALGAWSIIRGSALGVWEAIKGTALGIWEIVKGMWNGLWDIISAPFQAVGDVVNGFKEGINKIFDGRILDGILTIFGGVGKGLFDIISAPFKAVYDVGVGVFKGIGEFIRGLWNGISEYAKGIWNGIGNFVSGIWDGILSVWYGIAKALNKLPLFNIDIPKEYKANGGIVGGSSYSGDKIITGLNSREMVLNTSQQSDLFNFINRIPNMFGSVQAINVNPYSNVTSYKSINDMMSSIVSSILTNQNDVRTKPVGEKEYIYIPNKSEQSNVNGNKITVNDFNINLSGTIRLDGGNNSKNVDVNALLNDFSFMNALKEMIKTSINNDMNGGRFMNDLATLRGQISSMSTYGR